jgi:hypothetical protein
LFIAMWCLAVAIIARVGGWARLAEQYRHDGPFEGRKWRFRSANFGRWTSYGGVLTVGGDRQGLYLAVMPLFRIGHPPLFIPWQDVRRTSRRWHEFFGTPLEIGREPPVRVTFTGDIVAELEAEAGNPIRPE